MKKSSRLPSIPSFFFRRPRRSRFYHLQILKKPVKLNWYRCVLDHMGIGLMCRELIKNMFSFHMMGFAEFECGAVEKALTVITVNSQAYTVCSLKLDLKKDFVPNRARTERYLFYGKQRKNKKFSKQAKGSCPIYVLCPRERRAWVKREIKHCAKGAYSKAYSYFPEAVDPLSNIDKQMKGWLEIYYKVMFFIDRKMFLKTVRFLTPDLLKEAVKLT